MDSATNIASRSTYSSGEIRSSFFVGGCNQWNSFFGSDLTTNSLLYKATTLTAKQTQMSFDGMIISNVTYECAFSKNVSTIVSSLSGVLSGDLSIFCGGVMWKVNYCANNDAPTLCVDCKNPCNTAVGSIASVVVDPCGRSSFSKLNSVVSLVSVSFVELQQAPDIVDIAIVPTKTSFSVRIIANGDGTVNCGVFIANSNTVPTSQSVIILQNYASTLQNNISVLNIQNLLPASSYNVYCMSTALSGTKMSLSKILATKTVFSTLCCKSINVVLNSITSYESKNVLNMIKIAIDSAPAQSIDLSIVCIDLFSKTTLSPFFPKTVSIGNTYSSSQQLFVSLIGPPAGTYNVSISISGSSAGEYALNFPKGQVFTILSAGAEPPTPSILSATFLNDGSKISIVFDSSTNKGALPSYFSCSILMAFPGDSLSTCQWTDSATINVVPFVSDIVGIKVGDTISFKSLSTLKALCTSTADSCLSWKSISSRQLKVQPPPLPITPVIALSTPSVIGSCDDLIIDISGSTGNCGRPWANMSITVTSSTGNTSFLQHFLSSKYEPSPPTPIPSAYLEKGVTYNFLVYTCNFLGSCGQSSARVLVLTSIVPSVSILGPYLRSMARSTPLSLTSNAYVMSCDGTQSTYGIRYTWTVFVNGVQNFAITSKSKDPSKFLLPAFTLNTQVVYDIKLSVAQSGNPKTSTTNAQIYVIQSNIVAVISGGSMRSMHPQDSLIIDGSNSYDEDIPGLTGIDAGLVFSWSCYQISPTFLNTCGVTITSDYSSSTLSLLADYSDVNSTSQIVLTLFDSSAQRSAQARISVGVVDDSTPQVTLTSDALTLLNPSKSLLLTGIVQIPASSRGTASWSVDDASLQINSITALPVSLNVFKASTISQLIFANTLPIGTTLMFTLNVLLANGKSAAASVTVITNSPPLPGLYKVSPNQGIEIKTSFKFVALQWQDSSLPLSYQFGVISSAGSLLSLQSRSESSFGVASLPAGQRSANFTQTLFLQVYDSLNASTASYLQVAVLPMEQTNSTSLKNSLLSKLSIGNSSVNGIKSATALVSSILNNVNCSASPNCTALHRLDCNSVPNTCGGCISSDFVGDSNSNTPCIRLDDLVVSRNRRLNSNWCSSSNDCISSPYLECSKGICAIPSKSCIQDCSGNGGCYFVRNDNGDVIDECLITDAFCSAVCHCTGDWQGSSCSLSMEDMANRNDMRHQVVSSLSSLVALEDPTDESVLSWSQSLAAATQATDELHSSSLSMIHKLVDSIVSSALSTGSTYDKTDGVLGSLDSIFGNIALTSQKSQVRRYLLGNNDSSAAQTDHTALISSSQSSLKQYSQVVVNGMVAGQQAISTIQGQYRISNSVFSADSSNVSLTAPLSPAETANGVIAPSMQIFVPNSTESLKLSSVLLNSNLFGNSKFNSNPFQLNINSVLSQCASEKNQNCYMQITLQNNIPVNISTTAVSNTETKKIQCTTSNLGPVDVPCPQNQVVQVRCNSTGQTITVKCPSVTQHAVCNSVMGSSAVGSGCKTVNFTSTSTTCLCPLTSRQISGLTDPTGHSKGRRLKKVEIVQSSNSTYKPLSGSISFVAMLDSVTSTFLSTAESAENLNGASIEKSWQVLVTIGVFGLVVILFALSAHYLDEKDLKAKNIPEKVAKASESIFTRMFFSRHKEGLKRFNTALKSLEQKTPEMKIIESSLPNVLRSKPVIDKILSEERQFHKWFGIVFHHSPVFPRVLRVMSLTTSVVSMLFIQALTYNINNPDDGSCELQQTRAACLAQTSSIQEGAPKCYYTYDNGSGSCHFNQPASNIQVVMFVAIFAATVSTPIAISADWVICNLLIAKTRARNRDSSAVAPVSEETLASPSCEAGPTDKKSLVLKKSMNEELDEMVAEQQRFKNTLPTQQAKEFNGNRIKYYYLQLCLNVSFAFVQ